MIRIIFEQQRIVALSRAKEFARGAIPALVLAMILVIAVEAFPPTQNQHGYSMVPSNKSLTVQPPLSSISSISSASNFQTQARNNLLYIVAILLALLLSFSAYLLVRRGYYYSNNSNSEM